MRITVFGYETERKLKGIRKYHFAFTFTPYETIFIILFEITTKGKLFTNISDGSKQL